MATGLPVRTLGKLFPAAVPGYAVTSVLLVVLAPFFLVNFVLALIAVVAHVLMGSALVLGSLLERDDLRRWKRRSVIVSAATYALGLGVLATGSTLEVPFYVAWMVLTFAFPVLAVCVDWSAGFSAILGNRLARWAIWLILGLAFLVRVPFYLSPVRLSSDFSAYSFYASRIQAGAVPYRDVFIPYTPGFTLILQCIAWLGLLPALRSLLALPDLLVVFFLGRWPREDPGRLTRAAAWALFPLPLVEVAWSSHLDGIVALLILVGCVLIVSRPSSRGVILGFATALRPFAVGGVPSVLLGLSSAKRAVTFLLSLSVLVGGFALVYVGQLSGLVGGAVNYQLSRGAYNSFYFFLNWYAGGGAAAYSAGPLPPDQSYLLTYVAAATFVGVNLAIIAFSLRRKTLLRWYGVAISVLFAWWGSLVLFFPLTFPGSLAVSPGWPNYRPAAMDVGLGLTMAGFGLVMALECRNGPNDDAKRAGILLLFLNMALFVLLIPVYYAWYLLWAAPAVLLLSPRRLMAVVLVVLLASAPVSYYASDFNGLGSRLSGQAIPVGDFMATAIDHPLGGPVPVGTYRVNGSQGELYLSTTGNLTITGVVGLDPGSYPLLTFTVWSDHQSIGWNLERVWVWVIGRTPGSSVSGTSLVVADDPNQFVTGRPYVVNLLYTGFDRITGIRIRFDNWDTAAHRIWIGDVAAFQEYT